MWNETFYHMLSGRKVPILIVIGLTLVASGAGAWALGGQSLFATVNEPISVDNPTNFGAGYSMAPGETVQSSVDLTSQNDSQTVVVTLEGWNGTFNESGVAAARNDSGGYISEMEVGSARLTFDLLNDGKADYHYLDSGQNLPNSFNMTVPGDTKAGDINYTVTYARGSVEAGSDLVKMHLSQGATSNCDSCHTKVANNAGSSASIVESHEILNTSKKGSCEDCHGSSMVDMHMDCTAGCHGEGGEDIPTIDHVDHSDVATNDYTCDSSCHSGTADQLAHAHTKKLNDLCENCHGSTDGADTNDDLMGLHTSFSEECVTCHGISSDKIHQPYGQEDCGDCHSGMK